MREQEKRVSRRHFMRTAAGAGAAVGAFTILGATAKGQSKGFKVALIGCGGRGNGALAQHVDAGKRLGIDIQVVAACDFFQDRAERAGQRYGVPKERCFGGANGYKKLVDTDAEIVLMATSPLFRPPHFEACVKAGKHVFMEKPVAVDPPGCRRVIEAGKLAEKKGLMIIAGTQRRHERGFIETAKAVIEEKALGRLMAGRVAWCGGHAFWNRSINPKTPADLVRSWQNWIELSGDHIVEQHVHNIDVANWFAGGPPRYALGFGFRARRPAGNMYDFFSIDFDYGNSVHIHSMCRQISGCSGAPGQDFVYEKGRTSGSGGPKPTASPIPEDLPQVRGGHAQEHVNMLYYLTRGKIINEAKNVAEATAAAVLGRTSAYTGRGLSWNDMMVRPNQKDPWLYNLTLKPTAEDFENDTVEIPKEHVVPIPGKKA